MGDYVRYTSDELSWTDSCLSIQTQAGDVGCREIKFFGYHDPDCYKGRSSPNTNSKDISRQSVLSTRVCVKTPKKFFAKFTDLVDRTFGCANTSIEHEAVDSVRTHI
jgi:hypothetical protein